MSASDAEPVPPVLVARIVIVLTAAVVGVPEIKPVVVFTTRPAGKLVAPKEVGVPLAVIMKIALESDSRTRPIAMLLSQNPTPYEEE